ncbi:glycosyltransferase [Rathayibacter sp. KR2-224]|uniref:glycosyltransferase n=1 Tax=Rathayibacter sp. KR2-224 TaxID=3400913 RepID=UPI003C09E848
MRISRLFDRVATFTVTEGSELSSIGETLSARQRALLVGALNFHALDTPGTSLDVNVYVAARGFGSSLTDVATRSKPKHHPTWIGEFTIVSTAEGELHQHFRPKGKQFMPEADSGERHIVLDTDPGADEDASLIRHGLYWGIRMAVERRYPFAYDRVRQRLIRGREASLYTTRIARSNHNPEVSPLAEPNHNAAAVLFGLHWLDLGGAERWALKTIQVATEHGLVPVVITDVASPHPWITHPELADAVVIPLTHPIGQPEYSEPLLDAIVRNWDVRGIYVHHCRWLYDRLPWLRRRVPRTPVVDSQHILEYNGGGYPAFGVLLDESIDTHHVISPQLEEWLRDVQGVAPEKIVLAPLIGLTMDTTRVTAVRARVNPDSFNVGFVGRFAHQKRPHLFLKLVEELRRSLGMPVRAVIQGSGVLESFVQREIERHNLRDVVILRGERAPVEETLEMTDMLVISSQNEGIALTALEAIALGVPVLSADVGSQRTIVPSDALIPRDPDEFVRSAADVVKRAAHNEEFRAELWAREAELAEAFSELESADSWVERKFTEWSK